MDQEMGVSGRTETFQVEWQGERKFFFRKDINSLKKNNKALIVIMWMSPFVLYHPNENLFQGHPTTFFCEYLFGEANIA